MGAGAVTGSVVVMLIPLLVIAPLFAICAAIWTALDAARRGRNWFAWGVAVSATGVAFLAWLVVRRRYEATSQPHSGVFSAALVGGILSFAALNFLLVRSLSPFVFQNARIEGQAMAPTLNDQDRVVVDKTAYRRVIPRAGDVVMLLYPLNPTKTFIKRVIAEEGDQVRIVSGHVYRNDVPVEDGYVTPQNRSHDDFGPTVVPQGYYFVLGDRRNNSSDSRHWGYVPAKYITGKVVYRWWPWSAAGEVR